MYLYIYIYIYYVLYVIVYIFPFHLPSGWLYPHVFSPTVTIPLNVAMDGFAQAHVFAQSQCSHCVQFVLDIHPRGVHLAACGQWLGEKNCHWWDLMLKKVRPDWAALQSGLEIWQQHDVIFHFWGFANLQLQCGKINNPIFWRFAVKIPKSQYGAWMAMNGYFHGYGFYGMLNNKPAGISPLHIFVGKKSPCSLDHSPYSLYNSSSVEWQFVRPFAVNLSPFISVLTVPDHGNNFMG